MTDPPIELNRCAGSAEGPPSERIWVVQAQPLRQENPMAAMSPLRRRMIEDMTVRNLSPTTQRSYVHAVAKFSAYFGKSPDRLDVEDVRAYQVHMGPCRAPRDERHCDMPDRRSGGPCRA